MPKRKLYPSSVKPLNVDKCPYICKPLLSEEKNKKKKKKVKYAEDFPLEAPCASINTTVSIISHFLHSTLN